MSTIYETLTIWDPYYMRPLLYETLTKDSSTTYVYMKTLRYVNYIWDPYYMRPLLYETLTIWDPY